MKGSTHKVRRGLRHPPRAARRAEPPSLAAEGQQLVVAAVGAAQPQEAVGQDAALEEGVELVFDEARQRGPGAGLGVGREVGRVLLHQAVQRGLLGAVALVVQRSGWGGMGGARRLLRRPPVGHRHGGSAVQSGTAQRRPRCRACLPTQGTLQQGAVEGQRRQIPGAIRSGPQGLTPPSPAPFSPRLRPARCAAPSRPPGRRRCARR
ncbi:MAG: hypothetical protein RLZ83_1305 [Pseudomonadota bacterium]